MDLTAGNSYGLTTQDIQFEEEISRNPYYLKIWLSYLQFKSSAPPANRFMVYERALKYLPRSYKLWHAYLNERMQQVESRSVKSSKVAILINTFERSLAYMHKMPRIWCVFILQRISHYFYL